MELTLDQALQKGVEAHKAGNAEEAGRYYTAILKANPKHPDANHNMGVLAVGIGKVQEALPFFKAALESNPNLDQFWLSYIDALIKLDRMDEARVVFDQAKSKGATGDGFDQIEKRLQETLQEPLEASKIASGSTPRQENILKNLKLDQAISLAKKRTKEGAAEEAKHIYQDILIKFPNNKRAGDGLKGLAGGTVGKATKDQDPSQDQVRSLTNLYSQRQLHKALKQVDILVKQFPKSSVLFNIRGSVLKSLGLLDQAIEAFNKALAMKSDNAVAHYNIGTTLVEQGKLKEAIEAYQKALAINLDYADAYYNMGNVLHEQGKQEEAIEAYNKALAIKPDYAEAYNNMGVSLAEQGKLDEAIEAYTKALSIKPNHAESNKNMGLVKLGTKEWKHGIKLREWRWKTRRFRAYERFFKAPVWDGEASLDGKTLLIWGEQGPGDIIIWASSLNYYASVGANFIIECPPKLVKLLAISFPKVTVRAEKKDIEQRREDYDYQIPMETLFGYACLSGKISSHQNQYIFPDKTRVEYWENRLKLITEKPCIGISWKSPVMNISRQHNYADLSFWKPLLQNENYTFFNLQSVDFEGDLQRISQSFGVEVINFEDLDHYDDLAEVAAFCKALDKSISVTTTVAHISTAVGTQTIIPTWKQGSWNNMLFNSRGPKIKVFYRNTWESWENTFNNITKMLL